MFLRTRRHGMSVFSQLRRIVRPPSPQAIYSRSPTPSATPAAHASFRPPQLRVLLTQSASKGAQYPHTTAFTLPLNWSSLAHRRQHIPPTAMATTTQTQTRGHAGHSHAHHHHHDNTFLLSKNKNDAGVRITRIGLYVNLGMAVSKGFGGYVFNSQGSL